MASGATAFSVKLPGKPPVTVDCRGVAVELKVQDARTGVVASNAADRVMTSQKSNL